MTQNSLVLPTSGLPGLTMIQDINAAHDSMARWFSGPAAPTAAGLGLTSLVGVPWHDTTTNTLKIRDQADSAWIVIGTFDETGKTFTPTGLSALGSAAYATAGTGVGNVLLLSTANKLPALDGSLLTNLAVSGTPSVRNTAQAGVVDANGRAAFITPGAGLRPGLLATASALALTFASGLSDYSETISADSATFFPAVPANNLSFLTATRVGAGNVVGGSTLLYPQIGTAYDQTKQSLLHFENNVLDDYGNTLTASNVTYSGSPKFGSYAASFTAASLSYITSGIKPNYNQPFTIDCWVKRGRTGVAENLMGDCDSGGSNASVGMYATFLASNVLQVALNYGSSSAALNGPTVTDTAAFHHLAIVRDQSSNLYIYWDGVAYGPLSLSGLALNQNTQPFSIGRLGAYNATYFQGVIDEFRISPCARWTAAFAPPTVAYNVANAGESADWIDLSGGITVRTLSAPSAAAGSNPTFAAVQRDYLGECVAGSSTITSVLSYAFNGRYDSGLFPVVASTNYVKNHNIGVVPKSPPYIRFSIDGISEYELPGIAYNGTSDAGWSATGYGPTLRNTIAIASNGYVAYLFPTSSYSSGYYRIIMNRGW